MAGPHPFRRYACDKRLPVLNKAGLTKSGLAIAHQIYVERPHASEKLRTADGLSTNIEMTALEPDPEWAALGGQQYIERPTAVEKAGDAIASFGNIANTYEQRLDFWRLVEETERPPKHHRTQV